MSEPLWTFEGFVTDAGTRIVEHWYHEELSVDERDLIRDRIRYLQNVERNLWRRPGFDKVKDEIHEIRKDTSTGWIRIYGYFHPQKRHCFVLLHGHDKDDKNDKPGKRMASDRLKLLRQGKGRTHEFSFEERPAGKNSKGEEG